MDNTKKKLVRTPAMTTSVYRDDKDRKWYWTIPSFSRPVGPFDNRDEARADFRHVIKEKTRAEENA